MGEIELSSETKAESHPTDIYVVGKVGMGKSCLISAFLGENYNFSYDTKLNERYMEKNEKGSVCFFDVIGLEELISKTIGILNINQ